MFATIHLYEDKDLSFPSFRADIQIVEGKITALDSVIVAIHQRASIKINAQGKVESIWAPGNITAEEIDKALQFYAYCRKELLSGETK